MSDNAGNREIIIFKSVGELAEFVAAMLADEISKVPDDSYFSLALTGGDTPREIFNHISQNSSAGIEWGKVRFFWGDERCVLPDHDESNYKMASLNLLGRLDITEDNIFRIHGEGDHEVEALRYSTILSRNVRMEGKLPRFDLVMLGLGQDGHIASIFPGDSGTFDSDRLCEPVVHPVTSQKRVTISGKVINNARLIVFMVTGKDKAGIVSDILTAGKRDDLPASLVNPPGGRQVWLLDRVAASGLPENPGFKITRI
jgi:6-phosphogluconolactonase